MIWGSVPNLERVWQNNSRPSGVYSLSFMTFSAYLESESLGRQTYLRSVIFSTGSTTLICWNPQSKMRIRILNQKLFFDPENIFQLPFHNRTLGVFFSSVADISFHSNFCFTANGIIDDIIKFLQFLLVFGMWISVIVLKCLRTRPELELQLQLSLIKNSFLWKLYCTFHLQERVFLNFDIPFLHVKLIIWGLPKSCSDYMEAVRKWPDMGTSITNDKVQRLGCRLPLWVIRCINIF